MRSNRAPQKQGRRELVLKLGGKSKYCPICGLPSTPTNFLDRIENFVCGSYSDGRTMLFYQSQPCKHIERITDILLKKEGKK